MPIAVCLPVICSCSPCKLLGSRARESRGTSYDSTAEVDALLKPQRHVLDRSTSTLRPDSQLEDRSYSRQSIASRAGARSAASLMMEGRAPRSIEKPVVIKMLRCLQAQRKSLCNLISSRCYINGTN